MEILTMALDFYVIDFETANNYSNSACSVGVVRFIDGKEAGGVYSLIHPAKMYFIPEWTEQIHHISYNDVRNKPYFPEIWDNIIMPFVNENPGLPFVAHNARFDMNVIRKCCDYYGMEIPNIKYFDSLRIAQKTWPDFESHKLPYLADQFGIVYDAHNALDDSVTCGKIVTLAAEKQNTTSIPELLKKCSSKLNNL
jgi:DNA polymerase-3 subunit epsilon